MNITFLIKRILIITLLANMSSCGLGLSSDKDELRTGISDTGVSLTVQANLPYGEWRSQVSASVYNDAKKQPLVGGDVIKAESQIETVILKSLENLDGNYLSELEVNAIDSPVDFFTEYDPEGAREDRWYSSEDFYVEAGDSDLVGYSASVIFPAPLLLSSPMAGTRYSDRNDEITLIWDTSTDSEQMRIVAVQECYSDSESISYGRSWIEADDTGSYTIALTALIPSQSVIKIISDIREQLAIIIVGTLLDVATYGLIHPKNIDINSFELDYCDITLTVFREISGTIDSSVGGYSIGSASDTVSVVYQP